MTVYLLDKNGNKRNFKDLDNFEKIWVEVENELESERIELAVQVAIIEDLYGQDSEEYKQIDKVYTDSIIKGLKMMVDRYKELAGD